MDRIPTYGKTKQERQCLKCLKTFKTIDPKHNRLCSKCNQENIDDPVKKVYQFPIEPSSFNDHLD